MINQVILEGRMARDAKVFTSNKTGVENALITLAVDRNYRNSQGNTPADFVSCQLWGYPGNNNNGGRPNNNRVNTFARYARKGSLISIVGQIRPSNYQDKNGNWINRQPVIINQFNFLSSNRNNNGGQPNNAPRPRSNYQPRNNNYNAPQNNQQPPVNNQPNNGQQPQNNTQGGQSSPFKNVGKKKIDVSDKDLPF